MSNGQMRDDVKQAIECRCPVHLVNRLGATGDAGGDPGEDPRNGAKA
jgi:hypothetical protein